MISTTALLAAVWAGMWFAGRFVAPIRRLIAGAQEVSRGNLDIALPEKRGEGDLRRLSETFNHMTRELKGQQDALVAANCAAVRAAQFHRGRAVGRLGRRHRPRQRGRASRLLVRSAERLLGVSNAEAAGKELAEVVPEFAAVLTAARRRRAEEPKASTKSRNRSATTNAPLPSGSRASGGGRRRRRRIGRDLRRCFRTGAGPAHERLGGRCAPHRARDQEPADADTTFRRAPAQQVRQAR